MEKIVVKFIQFLRRGGISVSVSEGEDALRALKAFGVEDEKTVYQILKATLLKNEEQKELFDTVWRICFRREAIFSPTEKTAPAKDCDGDTGTAGMSSEAKRFYGLLRQRQGSEAAEIIEKALRENDGEALSPEELAEQLKISLGWFMTAYALKANKDEDGLTLFGDLERYLLCRCRDKQNRSRSEEEQLTALERENLNEKDFSVLSEGQVRTMEKAIGRLGKKLAGRYSYRLKPGKNGVPDMRKVMADTALRGHLPARMNYLNKQKDRPCLAVLCDISGSMGIYSSFCLQLLCAMEKRFSSVRSFLFIDNVVETSFDTTHRTVAEAVHAAMEQAYPKRTGRSKEQCTTTGVSDYGKAFEAFRRKYAESLSPNTTIIIVGDAKTNWFPPKPEELRDLRAQCAKLIWLNPEPHGKWDTEDSVASLYLPYCSVMSECRNLRQLEQAMATL